MLVGMSQSLLSEESMLLHATKQLNAGSNGITDEWELIDLADLNFRSAELAARKTSFLSAVEYLEEGMKHIDNAKGWDKHYKRCLRFSVALSRMQLSCGLSDDSWKTSDAVIANAKSVSDASEVYRTRFLYLLQHNLLNEALEMVIHVLRMLGEYVPRRFVLCHAIRQLAKARQFISETSVEELLRLPMLHDEDQEMLLDFLLSLTEIAFMLDMKDLLLYTMSRYIVLIDDRGMYPGSFVGILLWACHHETRMGNIGNALKFGELARKLASEQKQSTPGLVARADGLFCFFVAHWTEAFPLSLELDTNAFQTMWESGYVDAALMDAGALLQHHFASGTFLPTLMKLCDSYTEICEDYQHTTHWYVNASQHQAMLNFLGRSQDPKILNGSAMDLEGCRSVWRESPNPMAIFYAQFWSMILAFHFGDIERATTEIESMRKDIFKDGPAPAVPLRLLYSGLVHFRAHRNTGKRKDRRKAIASMKILQLWSAKGAINCIYMSQLLEAEFEASKDNLSTRPRHSIYSGLETDSS